jgi:arsenate reductase (glutaredoxin)
MTYTLYGIPNCDTVKKARTWLTDKNIDFDFHNFKKDGLTEEKVDSWLKQQTPLVLVNNKGTTFRKLTDEQKQNYTEPKMAKSIMLENSSTIKRPVLEKEGKVIAVGFKPELYEGLF